MELSEPQKAVLRHANGESTSLFAGGAVRSGKSFSITLSFTIWLLSQTERHDHAIVGQSIESIMRNVGFDFLDMVERLGGEARLDKQIGTRIVVGEQNVWLIGANDAKARRRIQGSTLKGLVVEELTLLPKDFFWMAWSRLSVAGARMWASYNPEGPSHWAKREVVDVADTFDGSCQRFFMKDNPTLTAEVIKRYENSFTGHFYKRLIAGEWAAAAGACFPEWAETTEDGVPGGRWHLALDWAASGTLAALAIHSKGRDGIVVHEHYHTGRTDGLLTEQEAADMVCAWWPTNRMGVPAWIDPATPASFKRLLREAGFVLKSADNDVVPGIITTSGRLKNETVRIHERCTELKTELSGYIWDDVAAEHGEDKPVKKADHGCDALRYWAHSTGKAYRHAAPTSVSRALQ